MEKLEKQLSRTYTSGNPSTTVMYTETSYQSNVNILADPVGSGKTLTTISFLCRNIDSETPFLSNTTLNFFTDGEHKMNTTFYVKSTINTLLVNINVIVVYGSVYNQWVQEFNHSSLKNRYKLIYKKIHTENIDQWLHNIDVIIVTYEQFNFFHLIFNKYIKELKNNFSNELTRNYLVAVKRVIFDEYVIEKRIEELCAKHYWFLSGSIPITSGVVCSKQKFPSFISRISSGVIPSYASVKNSEDDIKSSYKQAKVINKSYNIYTLN
jgi:archaellum component FlaG (FlaF/FlaG flagellin family)